MLRRVVYRSRSLTSGWSSDLLDIARVAFRRNAAHGVTGALYFDRERFFQVLEGEAEGVDAVMRSILDDPRHFDVTILQDVPTSERRFGEWTMRFIDGDADSRLSATFPQVSAADPADRLSAEADRFVEALAVT